MCRTATQGSTPGCQYAERLSGIAAGSCICDRRCVAHGGGEGGRGGPPVTTGDLDEWALQRTCVLGTWVFVCLL